MTDILSGLSFWLSTLDLPGLVAVAVITGAACLVFCLAARVFLKRAWLLTYTPRSLIRSAAQGYVVLEGMGRPLPGRSVVGPFSGRPCIWWSTIIEPPMGMGDKNEEAAVNPKLFERRYSTDLFLLKDGTGECLIDPAFAVVESRTKDVWYGSSLSTESVRHASRVRGITHDLRYTEWRIEFQETITASGDFRTFDGSAEAEQVDGAARALLSEWKRDQASLRARFDLDGDGYVDEHEWEAAREAARRQAQAALPPATRPAIHTLRPPGDDRELLISAFPRGKLGRRFRWLVGLMLFLGLVTGIISADAIAVGFGWSGILH